MATAKTAVTKKGSTAVTKPGSALERLAAMAKEASKQEASVASGSFISVKGGKLSFQGNTIKSNELSVVVADSILENCYYPGRYDPENPAPPVCYAFGRDDEDMVPHENSSDKQAESCKDCPQNKFKTADNGKGKACKNIRRLALLPAEPRGAETLSSAEVAYMKVPVTSVKGWASYVRSLDALDKKPPLAFVTTIGVVPDDKTQFKVTFNKEDDLDEDELNAVLDRHEAIAQGIDFPYPEPSEEAPPPKKPAGRSAAAKKKY